MSMKIEKMETSSFWKGEAGVKGLVEDQAHTYKVQLYLKNDQVRDYSCTCAEGNSYRGICAHGEALFAYYKKYKKEALKPPIRTSFQAHAMIREYTNRAVADILEEEEGSQVRIEPVLFLEGRDIQAEFKIGRERMYALRDLPAFCTALEGGAYVSYGKELAFHHQRTVFEPVSRLLVDLILELMEHQKALRRVTLGRLDRDRFFEILLKNTSGEKGLEVRLPQGSGGIFSLECSEPELAVLVSRYGRDGIRVRLEGVLEQDGEQETPQAVQAVFGGSRHLYLAAGKRLYCCGEAFSRSAAIFLEQIRTDRENQILIADKDIPLFQQRVLKRIQGYSRIRLEEVELDQYEPEPLKAEFYFEAGEDGTLYMEPYLSYGEYRFHPIEDEALPRTVCRDVPGEFKISQVIGTYFKCKSSTDGRLVIRKDEDALYRLLGTGMDEFKALGEVYLAENMKNWRVIRTPGIKAEVRLAAGWLELTVDPEEFSVKELTKILEAYSQKKKYYRLKTGQFLELGEGGIYTVMRLAKELGITKKELEAGQIRLPSYRALYVDHLLKEGSGVALYRDRLFKAVIRGIRSVEDSSDPLPGALEGVLREYQKTGYRWMKTLDQYGFGGILADDMGLGKTLQTIALLEDAYSRGETLPSLIVCPASLVYNWECEIRRFAPKRRVWSLAGSSTARGELLQSVRENPSFCQILITSYDLLKRDISLYQDIRFRFQIIDEAQYIKNAATQSARAVKAVSAQSRFALTGTPVENRLGELWSIFDYLMPGFLFGPSVFHKEYEVAVLRDQDQEALLKLKRLIGPFVLRRVKKDVLKELPDKIEQVVYSHLEGEQRMLYVAKALELKRTFSQDMPGNGAKLQILSGLMRLRQICCDPGLCLEGWRSGSAKLETCMDLIRRGTEGEHKILLFSQFTSMLERISRRLEKEGIESICLTGAVPKEERLKLVERFSKENVPVFLISLKAGGTGLNLTAADIVIHYDPWWNVAAQNQATDRAHRIGQEKQVTVYRLITKDTIEENILNLQEAKRALADQIVTGEGISLSDLTAKELLDCIGEISEDSV